MSSTSGRSEPMRLDTRAAVSCTSSSRSWPMPSTKLTRAPRGRSMSSCTRTVRSPSSMTVAAPTRVGTTTARGSSNPSWPPATCASSASSVRRCWLTGCRGRACQSRLRSARGRAHQRSHRGSLVGPLRARAARRSSGRRGRERADRDVGALHAGSRRLRRGTGPGRASNGPGSAELAGDDPTRGRPGLTLVSPRRGCRRDRR